MKFDLNRSETKEFDKDKIIDESAKAIRLNKIKSLTTIVPKSIILPKSIISAANEQPTTSSTLMKAKLNKQIKAIQITNSPVTRSTKKLKLDLDLDDDHVETVNFNLDSDDEELNDFDDEDIGQIGDSEEEESDFDEDNQEENEMELECEEENGDLNEQQIEDEQLQDGNESYDSEDSEDENKLKEKTMKMIKKQSKAAELDDEDVDEAEKVKQIMTNISKENESIETHDIIELKERISEKLFILQDFKKRSKGMKRKEILSLLKKDLCTFYSYNDFLMHKLMQLFSPTELKGKIAKL